ncbi:MAG: tetratricopeptide (TPR) repeat protein [Candidatus Latescibacterota bacterium]|jgi:tetratricopeptide (TPR) repeat protein
MSRALCLVLLWCACVSAQTAAVGLYNEANSHYRNGDFASAQRAYMQVVDSGVRDARLFYNLGNAHFKLQHLGEAILWYERAYRLDPRDEDIAANLLFANQVKVDRDEEEKGNPVTFFVIDAFFFPTLSELTLLFGMGWFGLFALGAWRLLNRSAGGSLWLVTILVCGGVAAAGGSWLGMRSYQHAHAVSAIVVAEMVTARSGPDATQTEVFSMHEGTKVSVVRGEGGWVLVRLQNGLGGWVQTEQVDII